jgi:hypothetical protein
MQTRSTALQKPVTEPGNDFLSEVKDALFVFTIGFELLEYPARNFRTAVLRNPL